MAGIREDVEKRLFDFLGEVVDKVGADRVQQIVEGAITGAARTKKAVDKNVDNLLALANIPSRRDFERMRNKLEALQGSVITLTRTVEELRERLATTNGASHGPSERAERATAAVRSAAASAAKATKAAGAAAKRGGQSGTKRGR